MFHNFRAHPSNRHALGVRVIETNNKPGATERQTFKRFCVLPFGNRDSPYQACQGQARILELCLGDNTDPNNPFRWAKVHLNLPTTIDYDPSMPRVMQLQENGELATQEACYVDDDHVMGRGHRETTRACKVLKSNMNSLGNQADDRKYRLPSLTPGAWAGCILHTDTPWPMKSTTGKKWTRFKDGLKSVIHHGTIHGFVSTGELRRIAGLGVHITEVYKEARCFLKGFFNAIESFRGDRDSEGWRDTDLMEEVKRLEDSEATFLEAQTGYPLTTIVTKELNLHAQALLRLLDSEAPLALPIRPSDKHKLRYTIGDASAEGFGSATQFPTMEIQGRDGLWDPSFAEGGSNLREAQCQVNHLLGEIRAGDHDGCEIWCFTDNAVWSAVWNKGMSSARHLFLLIVELKLECRKHEVYLQVVHISGDRMIMTGIDGWSRGNQDAGISLGHDLRQFIPIDLGAFDQEGTGLTKWCRSWMGNDFSPPLNPEGWFSTGHLGGVHVWAPPPAAALVALKELAKSRQKRPCSVTHVFLCQRLLYVEEWHKRFEKEMDVWFVLHPGTFWPKTLFEPLLVGISFPMSNRNTRPWLVRQEREAVVGVGRALCKMSKTCHVQVGNHLRQLWSQKGANICGVSERLLS